MTFEEALWCEQKNIPVRYLGRKYRIMYHFMTGEKEVAFKIKPVFRANEFLPIEVTAGMIEVDFK